MIPFEPITIESKEIINSFTFPSFYQNCDFSFANMCSWQFLYRSEYAVMDDFLLLRFWIEEVRVVYMFPVGKGNMRNIIRIMEEDSLRNGHPLCLMGVTPDVAFELETIFPREFRYIPERDYFDYIYSRSDLVELKGKKYQSKRNHINKFNKEYRFEYLPITRDIAPLCLKLEDEWCKNNGCKCDEDLLNERRAMIYALQHFDQLDMIGGAIRVDDKIVAFSFGSPINKNTFGIHVEKADIRIEGIYSVINQLFASHIPEQYIYVNREEDLGVEGLRKAKLSYHPVILLEKNVAIKKRISTNLIGMPDVVEIQNVAALSY
jgi:hypothetical protein